jgi:hypothetical protein
MAAVAGIPSLSALLAWPTDHFTEAADHWETVGERSYGVASMQSIADNWGREASPICLDNFSEGLSDRFEQAVGDTRRRARNVIHALFVERLDSVAFCYSCSRLQHQEASWQTPLIG